jgi:lipid-A-disaccharide synthase
MRYYLIAGEASGDLHGSNLIKNLKKTDPAAQFRGFGGDLMQQEGAEICLHIRNMSFIGIWEVLMNLKTINKNFELCREDLLKYRPDALILIDYPGFNLKMAEFAKENGIKTFYYIAPKVWASRKSRIKRIQKSVDKLYAILPFEEKYFENLGVKAEYTGNPLMDAIAAFSPVSKDEFTVKNKLSQKPIIALLSGSRKMEVSHCLPEMIKASKFFPEYQFVVAGAPSIKPAYYDQFISGTEISIVYNQTYDLLHRAKAAVVVSGTATLETALFKIPEVVMYKLSTPTFIIGRTFVHIRFFSLVNIIMDREVVKELLQFNLVRDIKNELQKILSDINYRQKMLSDFDELIEKVGKPGTSERVAKSIYQFLRLQP